MMSQRMKINNANGTHNETQMLHTSGREAASRHQPQRNNAPGERELPCPVCGTPMPDLKGGKATICPVCGFKDSCCF